MTFCKNSVPPIANRVFLWYTEITKSVWIFLSFRLIFRHTPVNGCMAFFDRRMCVYDLKNQSIK